MKTINNQGGGNCMYYAYGLSLMYFLRHPRNEKYRDTVFNRLQLNPDQQKTLHRIIAQSQDPLQPFNANDTTSIQNLLGPMCRRFAARIVSQEFIDHPHKTHLWSAAQFRIHSVLHHAISREYQQYIPVARETKGTLSEAEVFKVAGMCVALDSYARQCAQRISTAFVGRSTHQVVPMGHDDKIKIMDELLNEITTTFFTRNGNEQLIRYANHLDTSGNWGSEETATSMHRALTGEKINKTPRGVTIDQGDVPMRLQFLSNGAPGIDRPRMGLLRIDVDPRGLGQDILAALMEEKPGYILFNQVVFYVSDAQGRLTILQTKEYQAHEIARVCACFSRTLNERVAAKDEDFGVLPWQPRPSDLDSLAQQQDLILNNLGNYHWVSVIPNNYLAESPNRSPNAAPTKKPTSAAHVDKVVDKAQHIISATLATSRLAPDDEKNKTFKAIVEETIKSKNRFFDVARKHGSLDLTQLDQYSVEIKKAQGETDAVFRQRQIEADELMAEQLQEAELRRVGLSKGP